MPFPSPLITPLESFCPAQVLGALEGPRGRVVWSPRDLSPEQELYGSLNKPELSLPLVNKWNQSQHLPQETWAVLENV